MKYIIGTALAGVVVVGLILFGAYISITNNLITMQNNLQAHYDSNRSQLAGYARDIETEFGVANGGMDKLKEVLEAAVSARYKQGSTAAPANGQLFSMIKEAYPNVDASVYTRIADRVHDYEVKYQNLQSGLASEAATFDTYRQKFPARLFSGGYPTNDLTARGPDGELHGASALRQMKQLVTSGASDKAYDNNRFEGPSIGGKKQ